MIKKTFFTTLFLMGIFLSGTLFWQDGASAESPKLLPADESGTDESFKAFKEKLLKAVKERDVEFVKGILDPKIVLAYPDKDGKIKKFGITDFMGHWKPENPHSPLWNTLETIIEMGGTFADEQKTQYVTPYVHSLWPENMKSSEYGAILGKDVDVRAESSLNSVVIARLSHDIVKTEKSDQAKWVKVVTPDGKTGYVFADFIRSKDEYAAGFAKENGKWVMKWFVGKSRTKEIPDIPKVPEDEKKGQNISLFLGNRVSS